MNEGLMVIVYEPLWKSSDLMVMELFPQGQNSLIGFFALLNKTAIIGQRSHIPLLIKYLASSFRAAAAAAAFRFCEALGLRSSESGLLRILVSRSDGTIDVVPFGVELEPEGFEKRGV